MANLYVEMDCYSKAITLYNECINLLPDPKESHEFADLSISANYNLGIMYYIMDQYYNSKLRLETALRIKKDYKNEELTEQTSTIYETLGEIEIEYKNFQAAYDNLHKAIEIRGRLNIPEDKKVKMKMHILLDYIYQNLDKEYGNNTKGKKGSMFHQEIGVTKDEKDFDDLLTFIKQGNEDSVDFGTRKDKTPRGHDPDIEELEKFFLLMTKLSSYQIGVLNNTQGDMDRNLKLPILFSAEFKNSLTYNQRLEISNLKQMSLRRNKILRDPRGRIEIENLNYDVLQNNTIQNNLSTIKNYFVVSKIMKNWQITRKKEQALGKPMSKVLSANYDIGKRSILLSTSTAQNLEPIEKTLTFVDLLPKMDGLTIDNFRKNIVESVRINHPEKEYLINEVILTNLTRELNMEDLKELLDNPSLLIEALEVYNNENPSDEESGDIVKEANSNQEDNSEEDHNV
jgi:tetratricopeptide (TPR) repeat protein